MSFKLPPEIKVKQEQNGKNFAYIFRHEKLGELGRLVISDFMGQSHFSHEVVGNENDPLTKTRREILEPITKAMVAEVEKKLGKRGADIPSHNSVSQMPPKGNTIESQVLPCLHCKENLAHIIYSYGSTLADIEDCYRMMFPKLHEFNLPTWIVGLEKPATREVLVLKAWPERDKSPKWVLGDKFDSKIRHIQNSHGCKEKIVRYN